MKGGKNMIYRGNIIEVKSDSLIVMLDNCTFESVKKFKGLEEGMEIYFEERDIIRKSNLNLKNITLVAASIFLFIVTSFYGVDVWNTNYRAIALISVDINPSVEIKINKNNNVINAIALNEDAKKLPLKTLKNQPLAEALEELVDMARVEGYIKETQENYILVTSVELRKGAQEEKILTNLIAEGKKNIENSAAKAGEQVEVIAIQSNKETLKQANKENISVGKKELYQNSNAKQEDNLNEKIKLDKEQIENLKQLEKEAKQLEEKLIENQKNNNKDNGNDKDNKDNGNDKDNGNKKDNKDNKITEEKKDNLKENIKQEKDNIKEAVKENKDKEKELKKEDKDKNKTKEVNNPQNSKKNKN